MAISIVQRLVISALMTSLIHSWLDTLVAASFCPERQYLNAKLQTCLNCTQCRNGMVVLRPCEFHRDTLCATIEELLDTMETGNPHRHKHNHHNHHHQQQQPPSDKDDSTIVWRFGDDVSAREHLPLPSPQTEAASAGPEAAFSGPEAAYSGPEAAFSGAETLVWDWQAVALTAAVLTCILFFLVITIYSLHQARQWRRLKENFDADVEELSARLSLMAASSSEKELLQEAASLVSTPASSIPSTPDANYLNARCVYLEQLLSVRKDEDKVGTLPRGNVYIEGTNSNKGP